MAGHETRFARLARPAEPPNRDTREGDTMPVEGGDRAELEVTAAAVHLAESVPLQAAPAATAEAHVATPSSASMWGVATFHAPSRTG